MNQRHDEPPALSSAQRAEVLRLAARLQEEASTTRDFLLAAEEAGIERRFLDEAIGRLEETIREQTRSHRVPWATAATVFGLIALYVALPGVVSPLFIAWTVLLLVSFLFALPPCSLGRSRAKTTTLVFGGWALVDLVFMIYCLHEGAWGNFQWSGFFSGLATAVALQGLAAFVGAELARQAYALSARLALARSAKRRPQSIP